MSREEVANYEPAVIAAVCKNKDISALFAEGTEEMFMTHKDIWAALKSYYFKYKAVPDIEILKDRFEDLEVPEVSGNTDYYVERMRDDFLKSRVRMILKSGGDALKSDSPERALEKIQGQLADLNKYTASIKDLDVTDFAAAEKHYDAVRQKSAMMGGSPGIPFGFTPIDIAVPTGMAPGHLIVIIGWPAKGKTWFSIKLAENAWRRGFKPMIISAEMSASNMRDRVYTVMGQGQFRSDDLVRGSVNTDDLRAFGKRVTEDRDSFIVISPEGLSDITPNVIQSKIDLHKPDLVIVDYHQLLMDNRRTESMTPRAMNLSRELKMLAVSNNIPLIDITAATQEEASDRDDPPTMAQVAWSKAIEYDADLAIAIHRTEGLDGWDAIEVASRKVRHGREFDFFLNWNLSTGEIKETFD